MQFRNKVNVVDSIMGSGKTEAIISYINAKENVGKRFIVIVPYLSEVERFKKECTRRVMYDPFVTHKNGRTTPKRENIKWLFEKHFDIVTTHALFLKFDTEIMRLIKKWGYYLILDEAADVINQYKMHPDDIDFLKTRVNIDPNTWRVTWKEEYKDYGGANYQEVKNLCDFNSIIYYEEYKTLYWMYPPEIFRAFLGVFILTYMFEAQLLCYYMKYNKIEYGKIGVEKSGGKYQLVDRCDHCAAVDYKRLIHICEDEKLNAVGKSNNSLSKSWYMKRDEHAAEIRKVKNNIHNYFQNKCGAKSSQCMWGAFKTVKDDVTGRGYAKSFLPINARGTNEFSDRTVIAYVVNRFMNPVTRNFFVQQGIEVDEDAYALAEMLQFIWRSAIRNGQEIFTYIPSRRMRELLKNWIEENSV